MLDVPIAELTWAHLERLVEGAIPESQFLEFKRDLPAKDGKVSDEVLSDYAKRKLINEVVALANAEGGFLLIGVDESSDHPRRASALCPLSGVGNLAHRLALVFRDSIDPYIIGLETLSIQSDDTGMGAIAVRVPRSSNAPHMNKLNREIRVRRADRCELMLMREVHDLVRLRDRGIAGLQQALLARRQEFSNWRSNPIEADRLYFRVSAVPVSNLSVPDVYKNVGRRSWRSEYRGQFTSGEFSLSNFFINITDFRPIIRGAIGEAKGFAGYYARVALAESGEVDFWSSWQFADSGQRMGPYAGWFVGTFCGALDALDEFRNRAGLPDAEYGVEVELTGKKVPLFGYGHGFYDFGTLGGEAHKFPQYAIGSRAGFSELVRVFERDLFNRWS